MSEMRSLRFLEEEATGTVTAFSAMVTCFLFVLDRCVDDDATEKFLADT